MGPEAAIETQEIERLGKRNFVEIVGDRDSFMSRINRRALELLDEFHERVLIPHMPKFDESGGKIRVTPQGWMRSGRRIMAATGSGICFTREDLSSIYDNNGGELYDQVVDDILEQLYRRAIIGWQDWGINPSPRLLSGVVDMLGFPAPNLWDEIVVLKHMASRLVHLVEQQDPKEVFSLPRATVLGAMFSRRLEHPYDYSDFMESLPLAPIRSLYPHVVKALRERDLIEEFEDGYSTPLETLI